MDKQSNLKTEKCKIGTLTEQGVTYSEIAKRLGRSRPTISKYFNKIHFIRAKRASGRKKIKF